MESNYKLQLKIGPHEFYAEGPVELVKRDFELWKTMIREIPTTSLAGSDSEEQQVPLVSKSGALPAKEHVGRVFLFDEKKGMVTLRILPRSEDRNAEGLLLLVFGYRMLMNMDEVAVTLLRPSLRQSGCTIDRVDQIAAKFVRQGFLNKGGRGKGGKYSLTNSGLNKAGALVIALASS
jgi:hypothetical protein